MSTYKEKCPICGGTIEIQQGKTFGICDSCGNTISLSELSRIKSQKGRNQDSSLAEGKSEGEEYSYAFDLDESSELSFDELYKKIDLALEAEKWNIANEYCDEILKRNPKDAYAYLYKLLSELRLYKKEDLASCGKDFTEYENYRLFSRFADEYIKAEIQNYADCNSQQIQEENLEKMYKAACDIANSAQSITDYKNANFYFANLKGYKDSDARLEKCQQSILLLQTKEKRKKTIKFSIIFSVIAIVLLSIVIAVTAKKNKYDVAKIEVSIVNVEKKYNPNESPYINGCYYIYFDYKIKNGTGADIDYIKVTAYYTDKNGKSIGNVSTEFGGYYSSSSMDLKANSEQTHETYLSENQPEKNKFFSQLYETDFSTFSVTYKITYVRFSDGKSYSGN